MVIASYTTTGRDYNVVLDNHGRPVACNCKAGQYGKKCKHRDVADVLVSEEIERAATFLALKAQLEAQEREARETAASNLRLFYAEY